MDTPQQSPDPKGCPTLDSQWTAITQEIAAFDAKKLAQMKAEIEALIKKRDATVTAYKEKYPALLKRWTEQKTAVLEIRKQLLCLFPEGEWKTRLIECVCKKQAALKAVEDDLKTRRECGQGKLEKQRDAARAAEAEAKRRLDALIANAEQIDAALKETDKLAGEICGLLKGDAKAVALYSFWFKILPAQRQLRPDVKTPGAGDVLIDGETPQEICGGAKPDPKLRDAPWLIPPCDYRGAIDCAWDAYKKAKDDLGKAEAEFAAKPDDAASIQKTLDADKKGLEAAIVACLTKTTTDAPGDDPSAPCGCGEPKPDPKPQPCPPPGRQDDPPIEPDEDGGDETGAGGCPPTARDPKS